MKKNGALFQITFTWISSLAFLLAANAAPTSVRWSIENNGTPGNGELAYLLETINAETGFSLNESNFFLGENRTLARYQYRIYHQAIEGYPIDNLAIRVWTDLNSKKVIQVEALVDAAPTSFQLLSAFKKQTALLQNFNAQPLLLNELAKNPENNTGDTRILGLKLQNFWHQNKLYQKATIKGRLGTHTLMISVTERKVTEHTYSEFPQGDSKEFSLPAQVYPFFEESDEGENATKPRIEAELKYLNAKVARVTEDPYLSLQANRYLDSKYDTVLAETEVGKAQGYWSLATLRAEAKAIRDSLPLSENTFETIFNPPLKAISPGVLLDGRYAVIHLHPDAPKKFSGIEFKPQFSSYFSPQWVETERGFEMIPQAGILGKPITSTQELWNRPARRLPDHNPVSYLNDGFDEVQVYYAINTLFESLHNMGFTDPDLSTRPFNAYLYDPEISMRNNAYYTDDTINFTTYSPTATNFARDNPTIWHELGHGIMDRMMGDLVHLADTGGLSEGMADFIASLVMAYQTGGQYFSEFAQFRIMNHTGFNLTNEVHDDGEAYGGAMQDLLQAAIAQKGEAGVAKVADLTLEAMRLCRDHPALTAQEWFSHMLFADRLGHLPLRAPSELSSLILSALAHRNFSLDTVEPARFDITYDGKNLGSSGPGSRRSPLTARFDSTGKASYKIHLSLKNSEHYQFQFPVQVRLSFQNGPLQGGVHWEGETSEPLIYTLNSESDALDIPVTATKACDTVNREDGSCVDYLSFKVWNAGETLKPQAKKRFYVRVMPN